ncbi:MAG: ATP synthase F1 subunit delta [Candidatus Doudnabacteria bacterium]|nr:ATP synthase F1 subunit delta [Candidatus Doudnabacteria bacterium]
MRITSQQYALALYDAVHQTKDGDHDLVLDNFVKILAQNGELSKYGEITEAYKILEMKEKGITNAQVTIAKDIEINSGLVNQLNKIIGSKMEIKKTVDARIVGGVVVRVDDTLIDASVKTQLNNLNQNLKS